MMLALTKYKYINFDDVDLNQNKFLSPSEIMYILNSSIRYKCYTNDKNYIYKKEVQDKGKYIKIILEIFLLKDGLPIKEVELSQAPK